MDATLTSRDTISAKLRSMLDEATDAWGIKVNRVEVENIVPPASVVEVMEKQMQAERENALPFLSLRVKNRQRYFMQRRRKICSS